MNLAVIGGKPLSFILPGGDPPGPDRNCRPLLSPTRRHNGVTLWFYLNFTAVRANLVR